MTNLLSRSFPPLSNWQDFERLCFDLYSRVWQTNDAQMHGRVGQPQSGVDIYGNDRVERKYVGVQCKGKDQGYNNPLTAAELREEVEKAKSFQPALDTFILATTAPNDEAVQQVARHLTEAHQKVGLFEVRVEGWTTIRQRISDYPIIVAKYFADFSPVDIAARIDTAANLAREDGGETRALLRQNQTAVMALLEKTDSSDRLQMRITDTAKLIEDGMPAAGLKALNRLWSEESTHASPRNRYLMRANIGFAHLKLGDKARSIAELRQAAAEDPTWPNAQAILATAEMLDGHREIAFEIAKTALAMDSGSQQAAIVIVESAPVETTTTELQAMVPPAHMQRLDMLLTFAQRARQAGENALRTDFVARAATLFPQNWRVLAVQAEVLLEPIFAQDGMAVTHAVPAGRIADLEQAIALLRQAWDHLTTRDDARIGAHVAANLLSALEIAGRREEYEALLTKALNIAPTFYPLLRCYARSMIAADDWVAAGKALDAMPLESIEFPDRLLKLQASIHLGKAREAVVEAKALELEVKTGRHAEIAAALQIEAAQAAGCLDDMLEGILERWPKSIVLRSVAHNLLAETDPRRLALIREIETLARAIDNFGDRMHAAEALYAAKQFSAAADMYQGLCTPNKDALSLLRTLKSLFFAERRRDARVLFDSLDSGLKVIPRYAEVGVAIYEHAGLLREARAILEAALSQDDTLRRRVHWLSLSERIGDISTMLEWLKTVTVDQVGTPQDLMTVALAIDRLEQDPRCFGIAYRALRASYTDPQVHLAYMIGLFFMGSSSKHPSPQPTVAACDTAILLEEKDGIRKLVRVLETDRDPRLERGEIAPDSELGPALLGKKVGDEIEVPSVGVESTVYVIREIRTKYLHAHFRSLEQFEIMFPGHRAFGSFHIDESKGGEQFKPILDSVKRRGEFTQQLTDMYRKGKLPLMLMSKYSGVSPCDIWEGICSQPDLGLRVCAGLPQDYLKASENLAVKRRAIVDPITLYGITRLGIAERIRACFEDMGVVQTTIDLLRQLVHERSQERGLRHGTMGWDGEHYHMIEVNESVTTNRIEQAQAALMFAESLTLVAAEPSMALIADTRELFEDIDPSFLDSIYAAQGEGRLLLCDDQEFRQLAVELSGIQGIWTQAAALYAGQTGDFTPDDYFDLVGALVGAHYRFTTFDHRVMLHQMRKDVWAITPAITAFTIQLALPSNESSSVIRLLADLARFGWLVKPSRTALVAVFAEIFRSFSRLQPDRDLDVLVGEVLTVVRGLLRSNGYSVFYKNRLLSTTRLTPVEILVSSVRAAADRTFETVAGALAQACSSAKQSEPSRAGST